MSSIDWLVLLLTLFGLVAYGIWKTRGSKSSDSFLLNKELSWPMVAFSVMATQASAITFLSAPGQAFSDGMRFVQFYFGLPLAMIVLCITFIPVFHRLKVYTAYEYLESRFDGKTRILTAFLFLLQRGLSTGITIYAPSIVLSTILHIPIALTTVFIGILVMIYTLYGGTKAVSYTHYLQMGIIFSVLILAAIVIYLKLPEGITFHKTLKLAGIGGRLNTIDWKFDLNEKYNIWSGLIGGFFLALSYFGTDQSQVGRYLSGKSETQSKLGLILNGFLKVPMQFFILFIGILVYVFYLFTPQPLFFNRQAIADLPKTEVYQTIEAKHQALSIEQQSNVYLYKLEGTEAQAEKIKATQLAMAANKKELTNLMLKANPKADVQDSNYVFLDFVLNYLPQGLIGLLFAVMFLSAMGSTASAINSLTSTFVIDIFKKGFPNHAYLKSDTGLLMLSRWSTAFWCIASIFIALFAGKIGNLIETVNILGSLFYGTILGVFVTAFYIPFVKARAVFIGMIIAELLVIVFYSIDLTAFLWLNVIGCVLVMGIAMGIQSILPKKAI
jgi:Na+/proline symporter